MNLFSMKQRYSPPCKPSDHWIHGRSHHHMEADSTKTGVSSFPPGHNPRMGIPQNKRCFPPPWRDPIRCLWIVQLVAAFGPFRGWFWSPTPVLCAFCPWIAHSGWLFGPSGAIFGQFCGVRGEQYPHTECAVQFSAHIKLRGFWRLLSKKYVRKCALRGIL